MFIVLLIVIVRSIFMKIGRGKLRNIMYRFVIVVVRISI